MASTIGRLSAIVAPKAAADYYADPNVRLRLRYLLSQSMLLTNGSTAIEQRCSVAFVGWHSCVHGVAHVSSSGDKRPTSVLMWFIAKFMEQHACFWHWGCTHIGSVHIHVCIVHTRISEVFKFQAQQKRADDEHVRQRCSGVC